MLSRWLLKSSGCCDGVFLFSFQFLTAQLFLKSIHFNIFSRPSSADGQLHIDGKISRWATWFVQNNWRDEIIIINLLLFFGSYFEFFYETQWFYNYIVIKYIHSFMVTLIFKFLLLPMLFTCCHSDRKKKKKKTIKSSRIYWNNSKQVVFLIHSVWKA